MGIRLIVVGRSIRSGVERLGFSASGFCEPSFAVELSGMNCLTGEPKEPQYRKSRTGPSSRVVLSVCRDERVERRWTGQAIETILVCLSRERLPGKMSTVNGAERGRSQRGVVYT